MKKILFLIALVLITTSIAYSTDIKVAALKGAVSVRHGVHENWVRVSVGDILKPEDSIELDRKSSATLLINGKIKLTIPESVIIDISDLRTITQEDLLLKLAMENVRSVPQNNNEDGISIPRITTVHGENKDLNTKTLSPGVEFGLKQLKGTKVLFDNRYYATCVLKVKEALRIYPEFNKKTDVRLMVANAFEKLNLFEEALNEYINLLNEKLSEKDQKYVADKIDFLKNKDEK